MRKRRRKCGNSDEMVMVHVENNFGIRGVKQSVEISMLI